MYPHQALAILEKIKVNDVLQGTDNFEKNMVYFIYLSENSNLPIH